MQNNIKSALGQTGILTQLPPWPGSLSAKYQTIPKTLFNCRDLCQQTQVPINLIKDSGTGNTLLAIAVLYHFAYFTETVLNTA
jgi:hypothetical protein